MNKLSKTAKILSLLLNILCWTVLLGSLLYGFGAVRTLFVADRSVNTTINGVTLDYLKLYASNGIPVNSAALKKAAIVTLFVYFLEVPLMCWGIQLLRKVLKPMAERRPFSGTGKVLQKLGFVSLAITGIANATDYWLHSIIEHSYHLADLFQGSAAVFFLLSWVFRYGEELQQLSDETV